MSEPNKPSDTKEDPRLRKNWDKSCENCGEKPTVGKSRLCGPCFFGEADTVGGNW